MMLATGKLNFTEIISEKSQTQKNPTFFKNNHRNGRRDVIPLISNFETEIHPAFQRIYERNAAFFLNINHEFLIQHPEESNFTE